MAIFLCKEFNVDGKKGTFCDKNRDRVIVLIAEVLRSLQE